MKGICVLGSTGSIGVSTLDVVSRHADRFRVVALAAHRNVEVLREQCLRFRPDYAVMTDTGAAAALQRYLASDGLRVEVMSGANAAATVAALDSVDTVMSAIVGGAGLAPTIAAARAGKTVLLANKESLVMGGPLLMAEVEAGGGRLLPIDSEHNAIFQCLPPPEARDRGLSMVERILLTASGGPFRQWPWHDLKGATPEQACAHPNWRMGRKISVDSATMMNKGLELIEACWLFGVTAQRVEIVIHPQSVIHSMVEYVDGSVLAQLGNPDMRTPIAHALAWPYRIDSGVKPLDIVEVGRLTFERPDPVRFPCLALALQAAEAGRGAPVVLNAANEVAVAAFLSRRLGFMEIAGVIEDCLAHLGSTAVDTLEDVFALDAEARALAGEGIDRRMTG